MKNLYLLCLIFLSSSHLSASSSWEDSPHNWKNSTNNWENSPHNWKNSHNNWKNSKHNSRSGGVFDDKGKRIGYVVEKDDGDFNLFNNEGKRIGYIKKPRQQNT